jgi:predicted RNase H-like nuclease (RuvC/YqgF family)
MVLRGSEVKENLDYYEAKRELEGFFGVSSDSASVYENRKSLESAYLSIKYLLSVYDEQESDIDDIKSDVKSLKSDIEFLKSELNVLYK